MQRSGRRPFYSIVVFFCVSCAIYFVATGDSVSLGSALQNMPDIQSSSAKFDFNGYKDDQKSKLEKEELRDAGKSFFEVERKKPEQDARKTAKEGTLMKSESSFVSDQNSDSNSDSESEHIQQPLDSVGEYTEIPFMPKMANETLKAKLGNSAWHLFHTILARYPEEPTTQEKSTLELYVHLFAQVYPCGDCARHFQQLLQKYPVQVGSRKTAALWGCHVHNKVNERLEKPEYDCTTILEDYDCGCGSDENEEDDTLGGDRAEHLRRITLDEVVGLQSGG